MSINIKYLCEREKLTQNEFGELFGLKRSVIATYMGGTNPKIDTIQRICAHFNITIDDFVNIDIQEAQRQTQRQKVIDPYMEIEALNNPGGFYGPGVIIEELRRQITDKEKLINVYEKRLNELEEVKTKRQAG